MCSDFRLSNISNFYHEQLITENCCVMMINSVIFLFSVTVDSSITFFSSNCRQRNSFDICYHRFIFKKKFSRNCRLCDTSHFCNSRLIPKCLLMVSSEIFHSSLIISSWLNIFSSLSQLNIISYSSNSRLVTKIFFAWLLGQ